LWLFSGVSGVSKINPLTGEVLARITDFNGAVRGLHFSKSGNLLVSATNELSLVNTKTNQIIKKFSNLGVSQILYSKITNDEKYILAPAVWEGKILIIDVETGNVIHRITTGIDPVQIELSPDGKKAVCTHGRSNWLTEINLKDFSISKKIPTVGGPNGVKYVPLPQFKQHDTLRFCAFLPFTNKFATEGREKRLGFEFWMNSVNKSGGLFHQGKAYHVVIDFLDTESEQDEKVLSSMVEEYVGNHKIDFFLGSYGYIANEVVAQIAAKKNILNLCVDSDNTPLKAEKETTYKIDENFQDYINDMVKSVLNKSNIAHRKICILATDNQTFINESNVFSTNLIKNGFTVVENGNNPYFTIPKDKNDIKQLVANIMRYSPGLLLINGDLESIKGIMKELNSSSFQNVKPMIGINADLSFSGFNATLEDNNYQIFSFAHWTQTINKNTHDRFGSSEDYFRAYYEEYSERPSSLAAGASAVGVIYEEAIRNASSLTVEGIKEVLNNLSYEIFYGKIDFNEQGINILKKPCIVQISNGKKQLIWPIENAH
jgi:ABC-type branched-subunit amino acid transport system substrate-binding protein